ncbi:cysteine desulfurase family protein [Fructilactobacillus fructivorans]|uniref:Cysteine desulfurase n=1 Tax=Fructilactobacillus fructivorans TaxID=1614 RepID=A0A0C1PKS9_9LACO|nr:cysteine desulfurase family protein [Fructilactobacillus fructivorans]KID41292.1 Cysteine desulfurase [Fructilactobacillus fructivorans]MCT0152106.1 cysteine desulfurase [Fructilactobacillus fructivorans]MCT2867811.1 cysteine desulfurase [Fructilactobacillus fructivorans]MCT2868385.1 cysteine desulfurase [Fructilactobacillus fructivorans]MCT2873852.1 cysteine desulfurase [Fructilactobacillus fructivorans]
MGEIYLDNAATTPVSSEVLNDMYDKFKNNFGNASTLYQLGRQSKEILEDSRHVIAKSINANDNEIVFTSGGTESDNTAVIRTAEARQSLGKHIITTSIEHEAILKPMKYLEDHGFRVTYLPVDEHGNISMDDLKDALDDDTILVSIMTGNNEVGSKNPIHEIGELLKDHQAWFHTDAVQAYGLLDIDVKKDHIDLLSTSAHKLNGPKMIGFLYRRNGINFTSYIMGGDQEDKRRAGTENIPQISGFATAVKNLPSEKKKQRRETFRRFKREIVDGLTNNGIAIDVNGSMSDNTLPHVLNIWIKGISTYVMQTNLDLAGIAVSGGSACTAGSLEPSHVLTAMFGKESPRISESIRISFGAYTTDEDIQKLVTEITAIVKRLKKGNKK